MQLFQCFLNASCEIKIIYASLNIQKWYFFIIKLGLKDSINVICIISVIIAVCVSLLLVILITILSAILKSFNCNLIIQV